jgi:two-component system copper resistance phosphate regulon response regulator CusR
LALKLLIIEDEPKTGAYLRKGLGEAGFVVDLARDGVDGWHLAATGDYDLLVLDIMLPQLDGLEVLKRLRRGGMKAPVIFLTARDKVEDRVLGLESGADDYLVKPFSFSELLARIHALLRRGGTIQNERLQVADLEVDLRRRRAWRAGRSLPLTPQEYRLLELLIQRCGEVLPRTLIASQLWDVNFDTDTNVIDVAVRRLRTKVDEGFELKLIRTVRGMGYLLEAPEPGDPGHPGDASDPNETRDATQPGRPR